MWAVPVTMTTSKNPGRTEVTTLLNDPDMVVFVDGVADDTWIKLNPGQCCFYRTCYSPEMLKAILPGITSLSAVDRLSIENDLFALAIAGNSSTIDFLEILSGYTEERNYTVWSDLDSNLGQLSVILQNTEAFESYQSYIIKLYRPVFDEIGWDAQENEGWCQ